jgi:hypothetical protein
VTDGEDVEQNWEFTNGAAGSTKMMGPGGRHAFLEGLFGFHNWMRTVSYRKVFGHRLARDLKEGKLHKDAFDAFMALIKAERPDLVEKWRKWVLTWESEQHTDGYASPFEMVKPGTTLDFPSHICKLLTVGALSEYDDRHLCSPRERGTY